MDEIKGRCIWITGASSGIGRALAQRLCEQGNFVIVSARDQHRLQQMVLAAAGRMCALPLDLTVADDQLGLYRARLQELTDYLDMVICCAGVCEYEDQLAFDPAMYRRVFEVNFLGVIKTLHLAVPLLKKSAREPRVVALGSLSSAVPFPRAEAYGASKAALEYFLKSLQADAVKLPLRVTLVRPGFVATDMTRSNDFAMPFLMSADAAAAIIIAGISRGRTQIDFPRRLSWPLRFFGIFFGLWRRWVAPKVTRISADAWIKTH